MLKGLAVLTLFIGSACSMARPPIDDLASSLEPEIVFHVANRTTETFRVSVAYATASYPLGTVRGLEARTFTLPTKQVALRGDVSLVAIARDLRPESKRESERFSLSGVHSVSWAIEVNRSSAVVLR